MLYISVPYVAVQCLSVKYVNSVETNKHIFNFFSPSGSHTKRYGINWRKSCDFPRISIWLRHLSQLDRRVSSTFRRLSLALSGGVCLSRETDVETPCITESCLWQEASTLRRRQQNIVHTGKCETEVTSNKRLRCRCWSQLDKRRSIERPLCDS